MTTNPFTLFDTWFAEARESELNDSNAMTIATADANGQPSARMVLLKGHGPDGFIFYTNQESRKAGDIAANPKAAILFHWKSLRRQIRIEGSLSHVTGEVADAYFATRPRVSQLGAWASRQSETLESREEFEQRLAECSREFEGREVPRPSRWGGFRVAPGRIEFWYGAEYRLHERQLYERGPDGAWSRRMLYP